MKKFKIKNKDNQNLTAFLYGSKNKETAVIMCHGFSGSSSGLLLPPIAKNLAKKYLVLRFDFSGQGDSEGEFYETSISKELADLDVIVKYIKKNYAPQNIILLAHSFGAAIAFLYAAPNQVQGLISLSGEGDLKKAIQLEFSKKQMQDFKEKGEAYYTNYSNNENQELLGKQFLDDMQKYSTLAAAKKINCPVLFIHGTQDEVIPDSATREMYKVAKNPKKLILIKNTDHMYNVYKKSAKMEELIKHINDWLEVEIKN
jgi:pimeloyl-ACP methyl ester carboxylesterase